VATALVLVDAAKVARRNERRHAAAAAPVMIGAATSDDLAAGFRRLAERAAAEPSSTAAEEARKWAERVDALIAAARIPERYRAATFDDVEHLPAELKDDAGKVWPVQSLYTMKVGQLAVLLHRPGMVALIGRRGPGKTHMACALVNAFCRAARSAVYIDAMDYFIELQETYDEQARRSQSAVEEKYLRPELLVLDAMEERADTAWNDRMLVRLIDKRYKAERSTVLISNESEAAFNDRVGPSIADRIRDDGGKIECLWPSLRGRLERE
jgi:DNA replication protein DnaC